MSLSERELTLEKGSRGGISFFAAAAELFMDRGLCGHVARRGGPQPRRHQGPDLPPFSIEGRFSSPKSSATAWR